MVILGLVVLSSIAHHSRAASGRGLALFELEALSLWAAYAFGWSVVHGSVWGDLVSFTLLSWFSSAVLGLLLIPLIRWGLRRTSDA
jgi:hypothetical protein